MKTKKRYIKRIANSIIVAFTFLLIISFSKRMNISSSTNSTIPVDTIPSISYLALGDSYTIGESVPANENFPYQTAQLLREKNIEISDPKIIALTGWATRNLLDALRDKPVHSFYTFVTLLIGVNNQYQNRSLEEYKSEFTELINLSISYAGNNKNHVIVLSIPDYSVTPFAQDLDNARISKEIDEFNEANKTITLNAGVHYLDITPISREAKNNPSLIAEDGLHPSSNQYKKWSDLLIKIIAQEIR